MLTCAFCNCVKDKSKGVFLIAWPNGKAICNKCGPKIKKEMDEQPIKPIVA